MNSTRTIILLPSANEYIQKLPRRDSGLYVVYISEISLKQLKLFILKGERHLNAYCLSTL